MVLFNSESSADKSRADPGTAESERTRHRPPRERWKEARREKWHEEVQVAATSLKLNRLSYGGPAARRRRADDGGELEQTRRARREGGSRTLRRSAGGCTQRLGAAGTRGTMWKTALVLVPHREDDPG